MIRPTATVRRIDIRDPGLLRIEVTLPDGRGFLLSVRPEGRIDIHNADPHLIIALPDGAPMDGAPGMWVTGKSS